MLWEADMLRARRCEADDVIGNKTGSRQSEDSNTWKDFNKIQIIFDPEIPYKGKTHSSINILSNKLKF